MFEQNRKAFSNDFKLFFMNFLKKISRFFNTDKYILKKGAMLKLFPSLKSYKFQEILKKIALAKHTKEYDYSPLYDYGENYKQYIINDGNTVLNSRLSKPVLLN